MEVLDRITKYAHFCALSPPFNESILVVEFMGIVQKLHGNLKINVGDRNPIFTRKFWTEIFSYLGTQLAHSSSYHLQYNGNTKIVNKFLECVFATLHLINKHIGSNVYLLWNGGTILLSICNKKCPHLWCFLCTSHHLSHLPWKETQKFMLWKITWSTGNMFSIYLRKT